jgi:hypothetical protein
MQTANILLSLGGDHGNTIMKWRVTAAEIAVLRAIHGEDAVNDVEPTGDVKRSHRDERARLIAIYGGAKSPDQKPIVDGMFPGVAARVFETIEELELDPSFFKATGRLKAAPVADEPVLSETEIAAEVAAANPATDESDEGVGEDINDGIGKKSILD